MGISNQEFYLSKIEDYCYSLQTAIIEMSLNLPDVSTFARYLGKLTDTGDISYTLALLHRCWCFVNPRYLLDTTLKNKSQEELLDIVMSKFSTNTNIFPQEIYNKSLNPLALAFYRRSQEDHGEAQMAYAQYMDSLYQVVHNIVGDRLALQPGFTLRSTINTNLTTEQLTRVFKVISSQPFHCCNDTEENLRNFLSIFDQTPSASTGLIEWTEYAYERTKMPSVASIYTTFNTIGVPMSMANKNIIGHHFSWKNQVVTADQIKSRLSDKKRSVLETALRDAIG